jgi:hypothetical protein
MAAAALALTAGFVGPALAGGVSAAAPGKNKDALIAYYTYVDITGSPASSDGLIKNLGGAISGGFYGNTSNSGIDVDAPANGHGVTPSISPGPHVNGGGFCSVGGAIHGTC